MNQKSDSACLPVENYVNLDGQRIGRQNSCIAKLVCEVTLGGNQIECSHNVDTIMTIEVCRCMLSHLVQCWIATELSMPILQNLCTDSHQRWIL